MYRPITSLTALARSTPRQLLRHSSSKSVSTSTPNHQRTSGLSYGAGALVALVVGTALVVRIAEMDGGRAARAAPAAAPPPSPPTPSPASPADADADANPQAAAYDPVTGEINWDCPCLGGMADGPCGEEFKAAFACFVYSEQEPKGVDCVEKFRGMQECFRKYPEIYGPDGEEEEEDEEVLIERAEAFLAMDDDEFRAPSTTA